MRYAKRNEQAMALQRFGVGKRYSEAAIFNGVVYLAGMVPECESDDIRSQTADVLTMGSDLVPPNASGAQCIIEDATTELGCAPTQTRSNMGEGGCLNRYFRKYRVTSRVIVPDSTAFLNRSFLSQSELRLSIF